MTDSSISEGWQKTSTRMKKSLSRPKLLRVDVVTEDTTRRMENRVKNYTQWFPGNKNDALYTLSRDDDRSDVDLTIILRLCVPSQVPNHFEIAPLPTDIVS